MGERVGGSPPLPSVGRAPGIDQGIAGDPAGLRAGGGRAGPGGLFGARRGRSWRPPLRRRPLAGFGWLGWPSSPFWG